jgi:glycosyltransferase involved in cell wall biosynthesis
MYSNSTISDCKKYYPNITEKNIKKIKIGDIVQNYGDISSENENNEYILFVSTIQPRKNHAILLWVWRKLLSHYGEKCPALLLVGKLGYGVDDFLYAINNNENLKKKIIIKGQVNDAILNSLYNGCMFTIYPSLYEGWGLPIAESFARGKLCLASSNSSMIEIGGDLVEYIDPFDSGDIYRKISKYIDDHQLIKIKEDAIRNRYIPTQWSQSAQDLLDILNIPIFSRNSSGSQAAKNYL